MQLVNTDYIGGKELETIGLVKGSTIQARHIGSDILSGLKGLIGGELKGYSKLIKNTREIATKELIKEAENLGADAIINIRYASTSITKGASEILVYGTAVKYK